MTNGLEVMGVPAEIQEVVDERFVSRKNGMQREFRVKMKSQDGRLSERWLQEKKIAAGDLIYLYQSKRFDVERAKDLEVKEGDTMAWERKDSSGVNGVLYSGLEGTSSMGVLSLSGRKQVNWRMAELVEAKTVEGRPSSDAKEPATVEGRLPSDEESDVNDMSHSDQRPSVVASGRPMAQERKAVPCSKPLTAEKYGFGRESQVTQGGESMLKGVYKTQEYIQGKKGATGTVLCRDWKAYKSPMKAYKAAMKRIFAGQIDKPVGRHAYKSKSNSDGWSSTPTGGVLARVVE